MKKMIKTAAVIMSTIMVFSMTACAKKADPKEVFDAAVKKNSELTSLDMDTTMKMTMTQGEETMDITVDMNMKMSNMNEDAYVQRHKLPIYVSDIAKLGNDATRLCKKRGYPVNKVNIDRFGVVNVYPDFILHELLDDYIRTTQRLNGSIMR